MANTTNYNWETPDDTDLVKDGAAAIRTLGNSIDTTTKALNPETTLGDIAYRSSTSNTNTRLPIGSNGQILGVSAGVPAWINNDQGDITEVQAGTGISVASGTGPIPVVTNTVATAYDAKGDLVVGTGADTFSRLAVGTNGYTLVADSAETTGLKWQAASSGALTLIKTAAFSSVADTGTTFNTVFSSTYEYYILQLSVKGSTTANLLFQIRSGSTTRTANYYGSSAFVAPSSSTLTNSGSNGTSSWDLMDIGSAFESIASLTLNYRQTTLPFISGTFNSIISNQTGFCGLLVDNGSFDGFILSASTGNITGSASVYGLAKS